MKINALFKKKRAIGGLTAVILIISFALAKNTLAMPPLAVGLLSFTATPQDNAALLEWETATELGAAGFSIQRKQGNDDFETIIGFIDATGDVATGATYSYVDETAVNNQTYTYQLSEIETNNHENILETAQVTIGIQPTATPATIGGGGGNNNNPTATPLPTTTSATATATATTASTKPTTTSPTTVPTSRATAVATTSNRASTSTPAPTRTSTNRNPTATRTNNDNAIAFAQGETPTPDSYPATEATIPPPPTANGDYPANNTSQLTNETATPYPVTIEETTAIDGNNTDRNGANVIGSTAANETPNSNESNNSSTVTLWAGFLIALLIFIAGLVGTAVLFVRKK